MKRISIAERSDWKSRVENVGFGFHTPDLPYWDESACYEFDPAEISFLEEMTIQAWEMCLDAVQYVIDQKLYDRFALPDFAIPLIERSWNEDHPSIYGRFDFSYHNSRLKLLEFNADTPTALFEMAVVQWFWLQDQAPEKDQFNSAHEKLIDYWRYLAYWLQPGPLYFSCIKRSLEDLTTVEYLRDCAMQAGLETKLLFMDDIGWDGTSFVDMELNPVQNIFKLYPWEWIVREKFGKHVLNDAHAAYWIEPPWKMILSNKAILPVLYELYGDHELILPAYYDEPKTSDFVRKPVLGREGANVTMVRNGKMIGQTKGDYGSEGFVYQGLAELPCFDGRFPLIGSWIIGQEPAGIGIRESDSLITSNASRFVPHYIQ